MPTIGVTSSSSLQRARSRSSSSTSMIPPSLPHTQVISSSSSVVDPLPSSSGQSNPSSSDSDHLPTPPDKLIPSSDAVELVHGSSWNSTRHLHPHFIFLSLKHVHLLYLPHLNLLESVLLRNTGSVDTFFVDLFTKGGIIEMFLKRRDAFHAREMIEIGL
jgi:hypothetical protein